jgi:hypothetical protein
MRQDPDQERDVKRFDYTPTDPCSDERDPSEDIESDAVNHHAYCETCEQICDVKWSGGTCEPEPPKQLTHAQFHLCDPVVNEQMHSSSHSQRFRAKERQAFEFYVNGLIDAVPLEKLSHDRVRSLIKFAIQTW